MPLVKDELTTSAPPDQSLEYHWPESEFYVSEQHRLVYCPIQKVACSSLKLWWAKLVEGGSDSFVRETQYGPSIDHGGMNARFKYHHQSRRLLRKPLTEEDWFRFVFVRNPWSRLVSVFANKFVPVHDMAVPVFKSVHRRWKQQPIRSAGEWMLQTLVPFNATQERLRTSLWPLLRGSKAWNDEFTFRHFIHFLTSSELDHGESDLHWRPQYRFLGSANFHYVGRFERLAEDMQTISNLLGVESTVPVVNATTYEHTSANAKECFADTPISELRKLPSVPDYKQFFTPDLRQQVAALYRRDVEQFGYEFES